MVANMVRRSRAWRTWRAFQHRRRAVAPVVVESVSAWCATFPDATTLSLRPVEQLEREPPRTLEPVVEPVFLNSLRYSLPERYVARIPRARLIGAAGLVVLPDGGFSSEGTFLPELLREQAAYSAPLPRHAKFMEGDYFSLISLWAHEPNYYHWVHDALLRLFLVLPHLPADTKFVVPAELHPFHYETLALLDIGPDDLCPFRGDELWELDTLHFAPPTSKAGSNSPAALRWLRDLAWVKLGLAPASGGRRVFISRRQARTRRLVNEHEVEQVLGEFGFETFLFEDLTVAEQIRLMADAEVVASTSGAALTNVMFMPPGGKVMVMVEPVQISTPFWTMADALGHEYWYVIGDTVTHLPAPADADVRMDRLKVARTLEAMLGQRR